MQARKGNKSTNRPSDCSLPFLAHELFPFSTLIIFVLLKSRKYFITSIFLILKIKMIISLPFQPANHWRTSIILGQNIIAATYSRYNSILILYITRSAMWSHWLVTKPSLFNFPLVPSDPLMIWWEWHMTQHWRSMPNTDQVQVSSVIILFWFNEDH